MVCWIFFLLIITLRPINTQVERLSDTTPMFADLTNRLGLKTPYLRKNEFEVRIWNRQQLKYGAAQTLYILKKTNKAFHIVKYDISFNKHEYRQSTKYKPANAGSVVDWERLVQNDILTLPDEASIQEKLHPRPKRDSTWSSIEADGSVSVHARKKEVSSVLVSDGESFHFEVFSSNGYRRYNYTNPKSYVRYKPNIPELQKVVTLLNEVAGFFESSSQQFK